MKCRITKLRKEGVDLPKWKWRDQLNWLGDLVVLDIRDDGVGKSVKVARHSREGAQRFADTLYEPRLVSMGRSRFTLAGVERVIQDGRIVHYAQAWLCELDVDDAA